MNLPDLMRELSRTSGLDFEPSPWRINRERLWRAPAGHGLTVIIAPTRGAIVIDHKSGSRFFESPTTRISDVSTTIAFGLLAVQLDQPTPTLAQRVLARLRGSQRHF